VTGRKRKKAAIRKQLDCDDSTIAIGHPNTAVMIIAARTRQAY
jgi:hypothetical protein